MEIPGETKMARFANRLKGHSKMTDICGLDTASNLMGAWRWIDFIDPHTGLPNLMLEWLFGCRGMLAGRFVKVEADPGIGKSSYMFLQYGMGQRTAGAMSLHFESEGAPQPPDYIAAMGCNPDDLLIAQPRSIEECMSKVEAFTYEMRKDDPDKKYPIIMGIDSVSGLGSNNDDEQNLPLEKRTILQLGAGGAGLAGHARSLSQWFRQRGCLWLQEFDVLLFATAQLKANIVIGGPPGFQLPADQKQKTIADSVMNFNASYRLRMNSHPLYDKATKTDLGEIVKIKVTKNKVSPKNREIQVPLLRGKGFDFLDATCDFLKYKGPIELKGGGVFHVEQRGAWIGCQSLSDSNFQSNPEGKAELVQKLYSNTDLLTAVREALRIRGFGFDFEKEYIPSKEELEDISGGSDAVAG